MKSFHIALAAGASAMALASAANAVTVITLTEGSGWNYGENHAKNSANMYNYDGAGSAKQFTLKAVVTKAQDYLSFVDGYAPGDVYSVSIKSAGGTVTYKTQFLDNTFYNTFPKLNGGPYGATFGPDWLSGSYGHLQALLSRGTYTITVKDLCGSRGNPACPGFPAGWGIRLDSAVPEASTWAFMLAGVFGMGAVLRRRQPAASI